MSACPLDHGVYLLGAAECPHCGEPAAKDTHTFYLPIEQRILALLQSDLAPMLNYPNLRKTPFGNLSTDWWDGSDWKELQEAHPKLNWANCIVLNMCWDGFQMFDKTDGSAVLMSYQVLNLPPSLRAKIHIGMHACALDTHEILSTFDTVAQELLHLYDDGITFMGKQYYVIVGVLTLTSYLVIQNPSFPGPPQTTNGILFCKEL